MVLYGKIIKGMKIIDEAYAENNIDESSFRDALEKCLVDVCKKLDIPTPIWLKKNTVELAGYRKTFFTAEQFVEKVKFDKFIIEVKM